MIVLLDNGHGIHTPGKCSPDRSLFEWDYTRSLARDLQDTLAQLGIEARLIVPEDFDTPLSIRCARVNDVCRERGAQNVLLVSLHCNAAASDNGWHDASGWMVYVSPNASARSKLLATALYQSALLLGLRGNRAAPPRESYWTKNLAICRDTLCPAVLTENLFMDNRRDLRTLLSPQGRRQLLNLHAQGIQKYLLAQRYT